jgi:hypothetical protein
MQRWKFVGREAVLFGEHGQIATIDLVLVRFP